MTEGVFPKVDGDILYASEANGFHRVDNQMWTTFSGSTAIAMKGILVFTSSKFCAYNGTSTKVTSDAGANWSNSSTDDAELVGQGEVVFGTGKGIISNASSDQDMWYTTDYGDNWTAATTSTDRMAKDLHFFSETLALVATDTTGTSGIWKSTDGGVNWVAPSVTPINANCSCVRMYDANNGFAIDSAGNIYTTSDAGDTWADSGINTQQVPTGAHCIIALSATTFIFFNANASSAVETVDTTSASTTRLVLPNIAAGLELMSNAIEATNGYMYFVVAVGSGAGGTEALYFTLFKSEDDGVTWKQRVISHGVFGDLTEFPYSSGACLREYDDNKFIFINGGYLSFIDESTG